MADNEFRIESDSPARDDLMFWRIVGHEALARPSTYELTVLSKSRTLDAKDILGRAFDVVIGFQDADGGKHERHCQGHAVRFVRAGHVGRYFEYRILLRSWFWLLTKRTNSRILQEKKALEVLDAVFEDSPIKRFKKTKANKVIGTHEPRRYCVQHQESDYRFLSRLLEDEGMYYWFDAHDAPGTMHLSDASDLAHDRLPAADTLRHAPADASEARFNEISRWVSEHQFDTGKYASRDSDFKSVRKKLSADKGDPESYELADMEAFEFPGGYFAGDDTETRAKVRMDELAGRRQRHWALTAWPDVAAGRSFRFEGDPDARYDGDYIVAACTFVASHPGYEGVAFDEAPVSIAAVLKEALEDDAVNADVRDALAALIDGTPALRTGRAGQSAFLVTAMPQALPFRPPRLTPRATMPGPQSAIVVGPAGEEIHADDFGRVKVHFHWDRYDRSDEKSTCWVRVSQPWAGKNWGAYFIPRIGQEVIVDFLNGDPDRPIIMGRVYNDDQPIPFKSHTQSGFRTRSTPKGSAANFNEFRFEDDKGKEQVYLHAERNLDIEVEADETRNVGHDRTKTVGHDEKVKIKNDRTEEVTGNETITIHGKRELTVDKDQYVTIKTNHSEEVTGWKSTWVTGNHRLSTSANHDQSVKGNETIDVSGTRSDTVAGAVTQKVGPLTQTVNGAMTVTAAGPITFNAPAGFTVVAPGGTKIIDMSLEQFGGKIFEGYGIKITANLANMALDNAKFALNGVNLASTGMKLDKAMFNLADKDCEIKKSEALIGAFPGVALTLAAVKIFL